VTDDDKTLVKRLRWSASGKVNAEQARLERNAADCIEAQAAEIERLREAGTKLAGYAGHDWQCEDVTGAYPGSCSCGYTHAWKAWHSLAGKAEQ
jgi:hypothetical protein